MLIFKSSAIVPTNDYVFKRIFGKVGNEKITKGLLSSILGQEVKNVNLEGNTILEKDLLDDKMGILDIKAKIDEKYLCDIEMQVINNNNIEKRLMYYWSKLYISGIKQGENYSNLNKTISILISNYEIENLKAIQKYHTEWKIREKDYQKTILTDVLEIHIIELPKIEEALKYEEISKNRLLVWTKFLINPDNLEENEMENNEDIKQAKEEVDKMKQSEYEARIAELRMKHIMDSKSIEEYGFDKGLEKGKEEGKYQNQINIARKMLEKKIPIEEIAEITELTVEEIKALK